MMEFHILREARDRYELKDILFSFSGNAIFANLAGSRQLAHQMNLVRGADQDPTRVVHPGSLYAMGLIDEATHAMFAYYRQNIDPDVITDALDWFGRIAGDQSLNELLLNFVKAFPSSDVFRGEIEPEEWLLGETDGITHGAAAMEELLLLWLANQNTAFAPFKELFDDEPLAAMPVYEQITQGFDDYFATKPTIGQSKQSLLATLRAPALASPQSLSGQLEYIKQNWPAELGDMLRSILLASDILREEEVAIWMRFNPPTEETKQRRRKIAEAGLNDPHSEVPQFTTSQHEYERFSPDQEWMPNTVMIAKSTYVWLAQLSRQYGRSITTLNDIPDEELDTLASRGMNALWLIGVWERSHASKTIKRLCGNQDAVASAYSLYDYSIAADIGGDEAYRNLRERASIRNIRLASDMVPNHMGIDSSWVINHPDWFLSRRDCPYPAYQFNGPDLSSDGRVEIKIEDHYYEQSDAAVVFRRRDKWTDDTLYIYHGNDGTSFPWNDTAQLNYLSATVREQVIQTILHVARMFPIIRFDAAMTLAKRHIQRLWFPAPGSGGAIPSRAEHSMTTAEFDAAIPQEFWREVVDRVAHEVPGTLLLAEAFWLMEGYFVRTLGMHRVYNSAFMNMMRDEENAKYRSVLKNTLEFDPGIMKRYVNFMSNPDERTAIDQFGTGDKFFGVSTMMATLPGLPMFGHGQVEGFTEKYGMEYQRPRMQEDATQWLVDRHQREIAPLLHNRALFAESDNFLMYDFWRPDGTVDENVFAYSNRRGNDRALVIYHNRFASTSGTIHHSAAYQDKVAGILRQRSLAEGLGFSADEELFVAFRDSSTGLEYLRHSGELIDQGLRFDLHAYEYHAFLAWRELRSDSSAPWGKLHQHLGGAGVNSLDDALANLELAPVHDVLHSLLDPALMSQWAEDAKKVNLTSQEPAPKGTAQKIAALSAAFGAKGMEMLDSEPATLAAVHADLSNQIARMLDLTHNIGQLADGTEWPTEAQKVLPVINPHNSNLASWACAAAFIAISALEAELQSRASETTPIEAFERLRLRHALAKSFDVLGLHGEDSWRAAARVRLLVVAAQATAGGDLYLGIPVNLWREPDLKWLLGMHEFEGLQYFNRELHEQILWWLQLPILTSTSRNSKSKSSNLKMVTNLVSKGIAEAVEAKFCYVEPKSKRDRETLDKSAGNSVDIKIK
ncbi:alpha-amylase family glycosyl hydrolase [Acidipila rosea]|uniref:Glycosidase n=1 Tax=Acidipila rosea TaxID=768535 RepID=A0A4R1LFQ1_9BACT|nr:alpha-amylase family glycosyl hydrolase [Acidipila rosea]TCK75519.1 glycosidase [Acidipila rosea]